MRRAFTFSAIGRADLELRIADERLAEIIRLTSIKSVNLTSIKDALENYLDNLNLLSGHLSELKEGTSGLDKLLDRLTATIVNHGLSLNDLSMPEKIQEAQSALVGILDGTVYRLQNLEELRSRIKTVAFAYNDPLKELLVLELLETVGSFLKEDLLISLISNIQSGTIEFRSIENLPGNLMARLKIIDEARERVTDVVLRSHISFLRQQLLDKLMTAELLNGAIVADELDNVQKKLSNWKFGKSGRLIEQVKFSLAEAQKAAGTGDYGVAFGQISLANAILDNLIFELSLSAEDWLREMVLLKQEYDSLSVNNRNAFLEKQILELSDLIKKNPFNDKVIGGMREIKLVLAHLRNQ